MPNVTQLRPWYRRYAIMAIITAVLMSFTVPAMAITYGEPDGNDHPFVGSIVLRAPSGDLFQFCSGTLIAADVFLTAAHCTAALDPILANNPGLEALVTFDPTIHADAIFYTGTWYGHPDFGFSGPGGRSDPHDIAVIILDQAPGITPAQLPTAGLLDQLQASRILKATRFTAVGYGTVRETNRKSFESILGSLNRNRVDQGFLALTPAWLQLSMNRSTGSGGTCYGDSGGPHFIHLNGSETNIVVSLTVTGDVPCKATDTTYRLDTASARAFLADFVVLP
jgi:hypothetical protein